MSVPSLFKFGKPAIISGVALLASLPAVHAGTMNNVVKLGAAASNSNQKWAIFTLGTGSTDSDSISGGVTINGDIGVAGSGQITINGNAHDTGTTYLTTKGAAIGTGFNAKMSGSSTDSLLSQGVSDAEAASVRASGLTLTSGPTTIQQSGSGQNSSLNASTQPGDHFVLTLSNFTLTNSTLTLNGDANSYFVFNIAGTFALNNGQIVLGSGVSAANVLFNYTGTSDVTITTSSHLNGVILAAAPANEGSSNIKVSGASVITGEIIADKVTLSGASTVTEVIVSP